VNTSAPAQRTFLRLADAWKLSDSEARALLGEPDSWSCVDWKPGTVCEMSKGVLLRISHLLGIYRALHLLFPDPVQADRWLRQPNAASPFNGKSAIAWACENGPNGVEALHEYLLSQGIDDGKCLTDSG